jgi:galactose mutarotase-like enzyme
MSCNIDAFNNGMGLWNLEQGEETGAAVRLQWEPA